MTDESRDERSKAEAQKDSKRKDAAKRKDVDVETAELSDEDLEKLSGGNYTSKNTQSPFDP